ncbi:MAG: hypothetical protein LQ342_006362 [Letrouitia transgressa]|nr:MAG: hypothetical protein LQ342_006362 [Letrouitia transgressa]
MPPVRRYLRISKYSILECRIYPDNPADTQRWLLNERSPALPRVIESVRPFVLPKLREENARAKGGKGSKRKGLKDVVVEGMQLNLLRPALCTSNMIEIDDFEVSIFLTQTSSRHAILRKEKQVKVEKPRLGTLDGRLTGAGTRTRPVDIPEEEVPGLHIEDSQEEKAVDLDHIPQARASHDEAGKEFSLGSENENSQGQTPLPLRRGNEPPIIVEDEDESDEKKKLGMSTSYEGFSIYGRILCLVVKRRGTSRGKELTGGAGQAMMEDWIASTQMADGQYDG